MTFPAPRVSVVCPFFNEEHIIVGAVERMMSELDRDLRDSWELILVDDGSRDQSLSSVLALARRLAHPRLRVLSLSWNQGRGRAMKAGIDAARGDVIVTTEIDGSWGEDIVRRLVKELDEHPDTDFVVASPHRVGGGLRNVPWRRVVLTRVGNLLIRAFLGSGVTMNTGMTRAYRRNVIQPLVVHADDKEFHLEVLLKLITLGFRVREIPATITWAHHAPGGRQRRSSTNIRRTIASHLRFLTTARPVRYFVAFAALTGLLAGGSIVAAVWVLIAGIAPAVYLALIGLSLFLASLIFVGFAVLFTEMREAMRADLMRSYPRPHPPSACPAVQVFPQSESSVVVAPEGLDRRRTP